MGWSEWEGTNCTVVSAVVFTTSAMLISTGGMGIDVSVQDWAHPFYVAGRGFRDEKLAKQYANELHERSTQRLVFREVAPEARPCKMRMALPRHLMVSKSQKRANKRKAFLRRLKK
jgi:hypothetical protein